MVDVSVSIDQSAVAKLDGLLTRIGEVMPERLAAETRRAGIYICQSLKSRTKVAPKNARPTEYKAERVYDVAPYLTLRNRNNPYGTNLNRRWRFTKLPGTPDAKAWIAYPYTARHRGKNGRMVGGSKTAEIREMLASFGLRPITRRGLAKLSWGWVMKQIGGTSAGDLSWRRDRRERRDPREYVRGVFQKYAGGAAVTISNKLDYALDALPPGALSEGIAAAVKRMEYNVAASLVEAENSSRTFAAPARRSGRRMTYEQAHGRVDYRPWRPMSTFPF